MSFVQHTQCVTIEDKDYPSWAPRPTTTLVLLSIPVLLASLVQPWVAAIEVPLLLAYCRWWLYDRLICLGGDRCAIGMLGAVEPPSEKSGFDKFDTDYSINLLLAPHNIQELPQDYPASVPPAPPPPADATEYYHDEFLKALQRAIADDGIQGELIQEQPTTKDDGWDFLGAFNKAVGSMVLYHEQAYLHCEFEGGGIYKLMKALEILLPLVTAAAVVCSIPVFGWIACAILGAVIAVVSVAGIVIALNDTGKPSVVDPATGETTDQLHTNRDILFVKGTWVYDSAHEGWNELHPIKECLLVGQVRYLSNDVIDWDDAIKYFMAAVGRWRLDATDPENPIPIKDSGPATGQDWKDYVQFTCDKVGIATSGVTVTGQGAPEHTWTIHPEVDGCRPADDPNDHQPDTPVLH
jgi:hypothetical protein